MSFASGVSLGAERREGAHNGPDDRALQPDGADFAAERRAASRCRCPSLLHGAAATRPRRVPLLTSDWNPEPSPACARSSSSRFPSLRLPRRRPPVPPRRRASSRSPSPSSRLSWRPSRCRPRSPEEALDLGAENGSARRRRGRHSRRCRGRHRGRAAGRPSCAGGAPSRRRPGSRAAPAVGPAARLSRARR